jgi:hypothetical protein
MDIDRFAISENQNIVIGRALDRLLGDLPDEAGQEYRR